MNKKSTLGKVADNYVIHTNANKGITLVALVITIIIFKIFIRNFLTLIRRFFHFFVFNYRKKLIIDFSITSFCFY